MNLMNISYKWERACVVSTESEKATKKKGVLVHKYEVTLIL